jgi:hypothetical protein
MLLRDQHERLIQNSVDDLLEVLPGSNQCGEVP